MGWTFESVQGLTASTTSTELTFKSLEPGPCGPALDDVHLNEAPSPSAPEPGSLALLGLGLPMAGVWYRRRRSA